MIKRLVCTFSTPILFILSLGYGFAVFLRNLLFDLNFRKKNQLGRPVISVGNISVGGSGKTALVLEILKLYPDLCVLTRGYKSEVTRSKSNPVVVDTPYSPGYFGDEPSLIKDKNPDSMIVVDPNRFRGGKLALSHNKNLRGFLLDDGFQHRSLVRDLNIVLFDMEAYHKTGGLLPLGRFREPLRSLRRSDKVLITKWTGFTRVQINELKQILQRYVSDVETLETSISSVRNEIGEANDLSRVILFSGLGQPTVFELNVRETFPLLDIVHHKKYPDHHLYSQDDLRELLSLSEINKCALLCSEKDYIKIRCLEPPKNLIFWTVQNVRISSRFHKKLEIALENK